MILYLAVTCDTLACKNNGTCVDGTETTPNAMCSCLSGFTGLQCELMGTHSVDLDYLRSLSQKAYYTQKVHQFVTFVLYCIIIDSEVSIIYVYTPRYVLTFYSALI